MQIVCLDDIVLIYCIVCIQYPHVTSCTQSEISNEMRYSNGERPRKTALEHFVVVELTSCRFGLYGWSYAFRTPNTHISWIYSTTHEQANKLESDTFFWFWCWWCCVCVGDVDDLTRQQLSYIPNLIPNKDRSQGKRKQTHNQESWNMNRILLKLIFVFAPTSPKHTASLGSVADVCVCVSLSLFSWNLFFFLFTQNWNKKWANLWSLYITLTSISWLNGLNIFAVGMQFMFERHESKGKKNEPKLFLWAFKMAFSFVFISFYSNSRRSAS